MRILDLKPVWVMIEGAPLAIVFMCPHCVKAKAAKPILLSCSINKTWASAFPRIGDENTFFDAWLPANGFEGYGRGDLVTPLRDFAWTKRGTWETLTVSPSIDASKSGHWHGHIQQGHITGVGDPVPAAPAPAPKPKAAPANGIRCYFLKPLEPVRIRRWLRRMSESGKNVCPRRKGDWSYHDYRFLIGDVEGEVDEVRDRPAADDPRWPTTCKCGYRFSEADQRQLFTHHLFQRTDTGEVLTLADAGPGAMWFAPWYSDNAEWRGPDGQTLVVRLPPDNHDWIVDGRASNCTLKKDNLHKCWVRHGTPPDVTVDKNGKTCAAGAGSILTPKWHGFLRNGYLVA